MRGANPHWGICLPPWRAESSLVEILYWLLSAFLWGKEVCRLRVKTRAIDIRTTFLIGVYHPNWETLPSIYTRPIYSLWPLMLSFPTNIVVPKDTGWCPISGDFGYISGILKVLLARAVLMIVWKLNFNLTLIVLFVSLNAFQCRVFYPSIYLVDAFLSEKDKITTKRDEFSTPKKQNKKN